MTASIIIPTCDTTGELIAPCLKTLFETLPSMESFEVIVVANGASRDIFDWTRAYPQVKVLYSAERLGYPVAVNMALRFAQRDLILLLNDDVTFTGGGWFERLAEVTNRPHNSFVGPWLFSHDWDWGGKHFGRFFATGFWCAMFRKSLLDKIGYLDEYFSPGGNEDSDICLRADLCGYRCACVVCDEIKHKGSSTFSKHHPNYFRDGWQMFWEKWSGPLGFFGIFQFEDTRVPSKEHEDKYHYDVLSRLKLVWKEEGVFGDLTRKE